MPLDRRVTVTVTAAGSRNQYGEFVPGTTTTLKLWATRMRESTRFQFDQHTGFPETTPLIKFRIRWRSDLATAPPQTMTIVPDGGTDPVLVSEVAEFVGRDGRFRRRWLDLTLQRPDD